MYNIDNEINRLLELKVDNLVNERITEAVKTALKESLDIREGKKCKHKPPYEYKENNVIKCLYCGKETTL